MRRSRIGFVFQAFNLLPTLTAAENVALPLLLGGTPRKDAIVRAGDGIVRAPGQVPAGTRIYVEVAEGEFGARVE